MMTKNQTIPKGWSLNFVFEEAKVKGIAVNIANKNKAAPVNFFQEVIMEGSSEVEVSKKIIEAINKKEYSEVPYKNWPKVSSAP